MDLDLTTAEIELIYYCLEQQEYEFNNDEAQLCESIIAKFHSVQADD